MNAYELLKKFDPCCPEYLKDKTPKEAWEQCERGDWMLWAYANLYQNNTRELMFVKGICADTVIHLMKDKRSVKAVKAAIAFGKRKIDKEELASSANAAFAAYKAAYSDFSTASAVSYAALAAYKAASYDTCAAYKAASYAALAAEKQNHKQTADICREYLKIDFEKL